MKKNYRFPAIIEPNENDPGGCLYFPDLPGCVTCGDSLDEIIDNAKEILTQHLESILEDGESVPVPRPISTVERSPSDVICIIETEVFSNKKNSLGINIEIPQWIVDKIGAVK